VHHPTLGPSLVIANPHAGRRGGDELARLLAALESHGIVPRVELTRCAGDATRIAREAVTGGIRYLIAVGGDGTVHEVLNGLIDPETGEHHGDDPVLGVVSSGSGCDLVRTFGLDRSPEVLARHLAGPATHRIDVGRIRLLAADGSSTVRLFLNIAEVGFGGAVAAAARRLPARLGPRRYTLGIVAAWGGFRRIPMEVSHDGGVVEDMLCNVVVANGQFFGGGLKVAPRSLPDDGRFDLQAWGGSVTDVVRAARQLRVGSHLERPDVRSWPTATVTVRAEVAMPVEADGELVGWSPASFDILPRALQLKV
jgi:YegS/Rv2252/BmrU family lipid kinase